MNTDLQQTKRRTSRRAWLLGWAATGAMVPLLLASGDGLAPTDARAPGPTAGLRAERPPAPAEPGRSLVALPLSFEANRGQAAEPVAFLSRAQGYEILLSPAEAVLVLRQTGADAGSLRGASEGVLRLRFERGGDDPAIEGVSELPGRVNYLIGADRAAWRTDIPTFAGVRYRDLYPGIDLTVGGERRRLDLEFTLGPGADPDSLTLVAQGSDGARLEADGGVALPLGTGGVRLGRPAIRQESGGQVQAVEGGFLLLEGDRLGIALGEHDPGLPVLVGISLSCVPPPEGTGQIDDVLRVAVDSAGNTFIAGTVPSRREVSEAPRPTGPRAARGAAARDRTSRPGAERVGASDAFIARLDPDGSTLRFATYFGGRGADVPLGLAVDPDGRAVVGGVTMSSDLPTANPRQDRTGGGSDAFVAMLDERGSDLVFSTYLGGSGEEAAEGVALDAAGNVWVAGRTGSADFPTVNPRQPAPGGALDAFVAKLGPGGSEVIHAGYLGGTGDDRASGIAVDSAGNAYLTGSTRSADFPLLNPQQADHAGPAGSADAFVTKLQPDGTVLPYSTYVGGGADDGGAAIAVDDDGNAYVAGWTRAADFPTTPQAAQQGRGGSQAAGPRDAFLVKIDPDGALAYATFLGGSGDDAASAVVVDPAGRIWVTGRTDSADFPGVDPLQSAASGGSDAFVAEMDAAGALARATYLGGGSDDLASGIALDPEGRAVVAGTTRSTDLDTVMTLEPAPGGGDGFMTVVAPAPAAIQGCSITWDGGGDGIEWTDPGNWDRIGMDDLPGPGDATCIFAGAVTLSSSAVQIGSLDVDIKSSLSIVSAGVVSLTVDGSAFIDGPLLLDGAQATIDGAGDWTINQPFTWVAGTLAGTGVTTVFGSIDLTSGTLARTLTSNVFAAWDGPGDLTIGAGAVFVNAGKGVFEIRNSRSILGPGVLDNQGFLFKGTPQKAPADPATDGPTERAIGGGSTTTLNARFDNSGFVDVADFGDTLVIGGGGMATGGFNLAAGTTLQFTADYAMTQTSSVAGTGTLLVTGGTLDIGHEYDFGGDTVIGPPIALPAVDTTKGGVATLNLNGATAITERLTLTGGVATLGGPADLTINGPFTWTAGTLAAGGFTDANGGIALTSGVLGRTLVSNGPTTWSGAGDLTIGAGGTFINSPDGTFDAQNDRSILGPGAFDNQGFFLKSAGAATTTVGAPFQNTAIVESRAALLSFNGAYVQPTGATLLAGGSLDTGSLLAIQGGVLAGDLPDTISGDVSTEPAGILDPGIDTGVPGCLEIGGDYVAGPSGTLFVEIEGLTPCSEHDRVNLTAGGAATLDGTLDVSLGKFSPQLGDRFVIMTFAAASGQFADTVLPFLGPGLRWEVLYEPTSVTLEVAFACAEDPECSDDLFCNGAEVCVAQECQPGTPPALDDGVGCTVDTCDEGQDVVLHTPDDGFCDDEQFCNGAEMCDEFKDCFAGPPPALDDGVGCTIDTCDEVNDVVVHTPDDGFCDDEQFCNGAEICDEFKDCFAGTPPALDDGVGCTIDTCDEVNDVVLHTPDDGFCDNEVACDGVETCDAFDDCQAGPPVVCPGDGNDCTFATCEEPAGLCVSRPRPAGIVCDDGSAITCGDVCNGQGVCGGSGSACPTIAAEMLDRAFLGCTPGGDAVNGNYEDRQDRFRNETPGSRVTITAVETMLLNPEDLGFADIEPSNAMVVRDAAVAEFPQYTDWGLCYWQFLDGVPALDVPQVEWMFAEFPGTTLPVTLTPGQSFVLETKAHNDIFGPPDPAPEEVGELVIGWRLLGTVVPVNCGNGVTNAGEECDDGNGNDRDGCRNDCTLPDCGDEVVNVQTGETCDPPGSPAGGNGNTCRADCTSCGDGVRDPGEACDDGNGDDRDACRNDCTVPSVCGDQVVDAPGGETCDPPGSPAGGNGNDCRADCTSCGDGVVDKGEFCDDGNGIDGDACRNDCSPPGVCGDEVVDFQGGETCDPPGPACGNGALDPGEECDDGNPFSCDGCSADCENESGQVCGDGTVNAACGEECDDEGTVPGDGCDENCLIEFQGNTIFVGTAGADGAGCGVSPQTACATIQFAFDQEATSGDRIRVLPGTYNECVELWGLPLEEERSVHLVADDFLSSGDNTTTIIDGAGFCDGTEILAPTVTLGGADASIEGFTVRGGGQSGIFGFGQVKITNNLVTGNASTLGGGIYVYTATCYYGDTFPVVADNVVSGNLAETGKGGEGGGVYVFASATEEDLQSLPYCFGGNSTVTIENNAIQDNTAESFGPGLAVLTFSAPDRSAQAVVTQNTISGNDAATGFVGYGGGVFAAAYGYGNETIDIHDNVVSGNTSTGDGGGISAWISALVLANHQMIVRDNTVSGNQAEGNGGGLDLFVFAGDLDAFQSVSLEARDNRVTGNSASGAAGTLEGGGGGILGNFMSERSAESLTQTPSSLSFSIDNNVVTGNSAGGAGGGMALIACANADPEFGGPTARTEAGIDARGNLVADNLALDPVFEAATGGGIFAYLEALGDALATIRIGENTIADNQTDQRSGGVEIEVLTDLDTGKNEGAAFLAIDDSIVAGNEGFGVGGPASGVPGLVATGDGTYNLSVQATYSDVFGNAAADYETPFFENPAGNNLSIDPSFRDPVGGDYRLAAGSALIDAGNPDLSRFDGFPSTDLEGSPRFIDGDADGLGRVDIGYDEVAPESQSRDCRGDCTRCGDGVVDGAEACDDGNALDDDACRSDCTPPLCGDGIVDPQNGETCDPPFSPGGGGGAGLPLGDPTPVDCRADCTRCGDGVVNGDEECDDGNQIDGDACRNDCTLGAP